MNEEMIPVVMFLMIGMVISLFFYFRYRTRCDMQQTIRVALEKGHELSPELIDRLSEPRKPENTDLRRGVLAMALALAGAGFGFFINDEDVVQNMLAVATLPFFISLAYLFLWRFSPREAQS